MHYEREKKNYVVIKNLFTNTLIETQKKLRVRLHKKNYEKYTFLFRLMLYQYPH